MQIDAATLYKPVSMTILWAVIYSSDWLMSCWGAKIYHGNVKSFCVFERGHTIRAISEDELARPFQLFLKYLSELFITTVAVWILLYTCRLFSSWKIYEFICGALVLLEVCVHFRHIRSVAMFSLSKRKYGIYGAIAIPKWITLRHALTEFATFSLMLLVIYIFDRDNFFVLGGMCACMVSTFFHGLHAGIEVKKFRELNPEPSESIRQA